MVRKKQSKTDIINASCPTCVQPLSLARSSLIGAISSEFKKYPTFTKKQHLRWRHQKREMLPIFHARRSPTQPPSQRAAVDADRAHPAGLVPAPVADIDDASMVRATEIAVRVFPVDSPSTSHLALRFAHTLAKRQRARGLLMVEDDAGSDYSEEGADTAPSQVVSLKRTPVRSKNCVNVRRNKGAPKLSRLAKARPSHRRRQEQERVQLEGTIQQLRSTIAGLEASQLLADSALLTWRTNRTSAAVTICHEYFRQFERGFDPNSPELAMRGAAARAFMQSVVEEDVVCRDFRGRDAFLKQWQLYTTSYEHFSSHMCSVTLVDEEDRFISIRSAAEMRFAFNDFSLKVLYPHFYEQMQYDPQAKAIGDRLLGRECRLAFDLVLHFNQYGRVFAHESRVHLASALLDLVSDPFAVIKVLNASLMTEDGHWKTPNNVIQERRNELPKSIL
ncbi:hypothetical protein FI667_g8220, partial [Globisporangium splendens]